MGIIKNFLPNFFVLRLDNRHEKEGFTLLELIIVVIFLSILSAVAIPVFFSQVGKAREAEVKLKLGAISRAQTSYHYTKGVFAPTISTLAADVGDISTFYYTFPNPTTDNIRVKHQAVAVTPGSYQTRDYAIGVYYINGSYGRAICQGLNIGDEVNVGDLPFDPCTDNGIKIE